MKKLISFLLCAIILVSAVPFTASAGDDPTDAEFYATTSDNPTLSFDISSYEDSSGEYYLFLPKGVDASNLIIRYNREINRVVGGTHYGYDRYISVDATNEVTLGIDGDTLCIMQGSIPSLSISIDDGYSLDEIHADKNVKIRTSVSISGTDGGEFDLSPAPAELKTRGNSTFDFMKKPYQIKFDSKTDVFGMGKAKKWVLLANYVDGTMVRNKVIFDLADEIGMPYTCKSVFVDLYIDGDYMGVYQLCEKVEIGSSRVPLETDYGVVAEMEHANRLAYDDIFFKTQVSGKPFVYKEYVSDFEETEDAKEIAKVTEAKRFFENHINTLEDELFNGGSDWELVSSMIDVESFINFYFIVEFCENVDATLASTYFYMDGPGDVLHCGPLWDYDRCFGTSNEGMDREADFLKNVVDTVDKYRVDWFKMLFRYPEFAELVNEAYDERISDAFDAEKVASQIDEYEELLRPSLRMNHVKWVVFHTINDLVEDIFHGTTDEYLDYTINAVKEFISDRKDHLDACYGKYHPVLTYATAQGKVWTRTYTGGCMTDEKTAVRHLKMNIENSIFDGDILYGFFNGGNDMGYVLGGEDLTGEKFQGLYIELTGELDQYFSIEYRAYINGAWTDWESDGTLVGNESGSYYISRIQARLVEYKELSDVYGDVNCDGKVNLADVYMMKSIIAGKITRGVALYKADMNGDGSVNLSDIYLIKNVIV